jgi:hypothetical protein
MDRAVAPRVPQANNLNNFRDGLGERRRVNHTAGDTIELLCLRRELTTVPSFEFALRERASRLASFRHDAFAPVRSIDRLSEPSAALAVVSDFTRGVRLSHLLTPNDRRPVTIDINAAQRLIQQIVSAVAALHDSARDVVHGAIGPERVIVTANAGAVVVEYVLGAALEQLRYSPERYWKQLRIALPPTSAAAGPAKFDHRTDVTQLGIVALSLVLGRLLTDDEYPARLGDVLASARAISARGGDEPLSYGLREWIGRALQLDVRHSFASACEARADLEKILPGTTGSETADRMGKPESKIAIDSKSFMRPPEPEAVVTRAIQKTAISFPHPEPAAGAREAQMAPSAPPVKAIAAPTPLLTLAPRMVSPPIIESSSVDLPDTAFDDEVSEDGAEESAERKPWLRLTVAAIAVAGLVAACTYGGRSFFSTSEHAVRTGTLNVASNPAGAQVFVDRQGRGMTPVTLTLQPGPHTVEFRGIGEPRTLDVNVAAGTQTSQFIELAKAVPASIVSQTVAVAASTAASPPVPMAGSPKAPLSGWVTVTAPVDVDVREHGKVLGTSQSDRIVVPAGRHELEVVSDTLGYRATAVVQVLPGKVAPIRIEWPKGTVALNAEPWAEVSIDGEKVGDTPIGNLSLPIGPHEIVFRHPELGEQRHAISVSLKAPSRLSVDMRRQP